MTYKDRLGNEVSEGDIIFYTEDYSYAESIQVIVNENDTLLSKTVVVNRGGVYKNFEDKHPTPLRFYTNGHLGGDPSLLTDAVRIGRFGEDDHMLTVEYAEKTFPIPFIHKS